MADQVHLVSLYFVYLIHRLISNYLAMDSEATYWFTIGAINENGVSEKFKTIEVK
jgi:hypothetical protein